MKLLFLSDIHGVPDTLELLLKHAAACSPDYLVLLGDVLYHGPRNGVPGFYDPRRSASLLNERKNTIIAVRGNCDADVDQYMLQFPVLSDYSEILTDSVRFFLTHGHIWNESNLPPLSPGTVFVQGHTHVPMIKNLPNGTLYFNPGSISLPKCDSPRSFGFFDGSVLSIRKLEDGEPFLQVDVPMMFEKKS